VPRALAPISIPPTLLRVSALLTRTRRMTVRSAVDCSGVGLADRPCGCPGLYRGRRLSATAQYDASDQRGGTGAAESLRRTERIERASPGSVLRSMPSNTSIPRQIARATSVGASPSGWPIACSVKPPRDGAGDSDELVGRGQGRHWAILWRGDDHAVPSGRFASLRIGLCLTRCFASRARNAGVARPTRSQVITENVTQKEPGVHAAE
jgi:hypothetical protein